MSILVVDASRQNSDFFSALLRDSALHEQIIDESADAASRRLGLDGGETDAIGINVVILDASQPDAHALDLCRKIRNTDALEDVPVLVITPGAEMNHFEAALSAGATDCIPRPLKKPEALARLQTALALKRELERRKAAERELVETARSLERLSFVDELTGTLNRRAFDRMLDREYRRAVRDGVPLSLLMVEIDRFEACRKAMGNIEADECLSRVVEALGSAVHRPADSLARYGGDKVAVILPDTPAEGASKVAEAMRRAVDDLAMFFDRGGVRGRVSVSVGAATAAAAKDIELPALLLAAHEALEQAKQAGGNRVKADTL